MHQIYHETPRFKTLRQARAELAIKVIEELNGVLPVYLTRWPDEPPEVPKPLRDLMLNVTGVRLGDVERALAPLHFFSQAELNQALTDLADEGRIEFMANEGGILAIDKTRAAEVEPVCRKDPRDRETSRRE